jgi:hypothetical protein
MREYLAVRLRRSKAGLEGFGGEAISMVDAVIESVLCSPEYHFSEVIKLLLSSGASIARIPPDLAPLAACLQEDSAEESVKILRETWMSRPELFQNTWQAVLLRCGLHSWGFVYLCAHTLFLL